MPRRRSVPREPASPEGAQSGLERGRTARTRPSDPAILAMSHVWSPAPAATSRTRLPLRMPACPIMARVAASSHGRMTGVCASHPAAADSLFASNSASLVPVGFGRHDAALLPAGPWRDARPIEGIGTPSPRAVGRNCARGPQSCIVPLGFGVELVPSMFDWNDVKFLLAVGRHGSTMAVARTLGVPPIHGAAPAGGARAATGASAGRTASGRISADAHWSVAAAGRGNHRTRGRRDRAGRGVRLQ